ncbi:cysteine desulfurase family protein [Staphylococcus delphini]|uniref:Aminotransferase n=1 Tax=Staphylococcus delphini TaxID=53344 RepID=A0A2A4GXJ4_9STAP|nr:cysteine desulfurase family protein [Staphylococcus delphini]MBZ8174903.1 cysteine desulfurase [Staphylococcus delphini]MTV20172.1 aminotransferase class V-fold PLP-dependent enzyme [Staphylococcus delphini]PCF55548.1 aminotransferase [Staphylococcus delphini]PCF62130.1 aminotransferase [Staphylococcus delphini]PCF75305.1 aminotransferase [Staphylococcus delphini]
MLYFDNAATTKPDPSVLSSFMKVNEKFFYNPNSPHEKGQEVERLLQNARDQIKSTLKLNDETLIFTSGATESNNMALKGAAHQKKHFGRTIITSLLEHPSVLEVMRELEREGFILKYVNVTAEGRIDIDHLKSLLSNDVILVTCMQVNNIMGQRQPIEAIVESLKPYPKVHFHVDAVQALGKWPIQMTGIDSLSLSGHKFNGLKGQGLLILKNLHQIYPIIQGGGQEFGLRSGTVNVASDVALAKAIRLAEDQRDALIQTLSTFTTALREMIQDYPGVVINSPVDASPHILNLAFPGVRGEVLVNAFSKQGIMISTTSACSSKHSNVNEVLKAMNISVSRILGSIRLSFDRHTTMQDIETFKAAFHQVYREVEELLEK